MTHVLHTAGVNDVEVFCVQMVMGNHIFLYPMFVTCWYIFLNSWPSLKFTIFLSLSTLFMFKDTL